MNIDHKIAQLLVSRVCHDLAGGVSAVSTGAELLSEDQSMIDENALNVIALSARQCASRLAFFRVAFGLGGGDNDTITSDELKTIVQNYLEGGRISLVWATENRRVGLMAAKLLMNLVLMACESLPKGGVLEIGIAEIGDKLGFAVSARGDGAQFRPGIVGAARLDCDPMDLNARTVHAHFAAVLAVSLEAEMEIQGDAEGEIRLAALV